MAGRAVPLFAAFVRSASALMQLPSASSDRLMFAPSTSRLPALSVLYARSDPARSIRDNFPIVRGGGSVESLNL